MRTIDLTDEMVNNIVTQTLQQDLQMELNAIVVLEMKKKRKEFEEQDYAMSLVYSQALRTVLKYYGIDA